MTAQDEVEHARSREVPEDAYPMIADEMLCQVVSAWRQAGRFDTWDMVKGEQVGGWEDAWALLPLPVIELSRAMGVNTDVAEEKLRQAMALRLVYPDGTAHQFATATVRAKVRQALGLKVESKGAR